MKGLSGNELLVSDNKIKKKKKKINNVKTEENRETFDSFIPAKDDRCMYVMWRCSSIISI